MTPDWQRRFRAMVAAACDQADSIRLDIRKPSRAYLYYKPATATAWGDLIALCDPENAPAGYLPVIPNAIPGDWPRGTIATRLQAVLSRTPVIGPDA
jgi:hypothetical protein